MEHNAAGMPMDRDAIARQLLGHTLHGGEDSRGEGLGWEGLGLLCGGSHYPATTDENGSKSGWVRIAAFRL